MLELENKNAEISPITEINWNDQPGYTDIADIRPLAIDESRMARVGQGKLIEWSPGQPIDTLASQGFGKCAAVIIHDKESGRYVLAHSQPLDDQLYDEMSRLPISPDEAVIIYGTESVHQYDIQQLLAAKGARIIPINVETGKAHFGVLLDTRTGIVSVVRKAPSQSMLQYSPFENRAK